MDRVVEMADVDHPHQNANDRDELRQLLAKLVDFDGQWRLFLLRIRHFISKGQDQGSKTGKSRLSALTRIVFLRRRAIDLPPILPNWKSIQPRNGNVNPFLYLIRPISVFCPMLTTMPSALPAETLVPLKSMFFLSWLTARGSGTGSLCLMIDTDSPVSSD